MDPITELKIRAERLQHRVQASDPAALGRLRVLQELRKADEAALRNFAPTIQRKHCLLAVAREAGFASWEHAKRVFVGDAAEADFGKLLYGATWGAHLNHWFATYEDARTFFDEPLTTVGDRHYLLAYQRHFFVADQHFIQALGVSPDDADWEAIGWDWAKPRSFDARRRLYGKVLAAARTA